MICIRQPASTSGADNAGLAMIPALRSGCERIPTMPAALQLREQAVERDVDFVRKFEQDVPAVIGQREDFSLPHQRDHARLDPDVGPRQDRQRNLMLGQQLRPVPRSAARIVSPWFWAKPPNWCGVTTIVSMPSATAIRAMASDSSQLLAPSSMPRQQMAVNVDETGRSDSCGSVHDGQLELRRLVAVDGAAGNAGAPTAPPRRLCALRRDYA